MGKVISICTNQVFIFYCNWFNWWYLIGHKTVTNLMVQPRPTTKKYIVFNECSCRSLVNVSAADPRNHYACLEDLGPTFDRLFCLDLFKHLWTGWIHLKPESSLEKYFSGISPLRVSYDSKSRCQTHHTVEHAALEEAVLRSSKSVLHSCSFFNFVVLVVTRLEMVEWPQDKETPITVHLSRFHRTIKTSRDFMPL